MPTWAFITILLIFFLTFIWVCQPFTSSISPKMRIWNTLSTDIQQQKSYLRFLNWLSSQENRQEDGNKNTIFISAPPFQPVSREHMNSPQNRGSVWCKQTLQLPQTDTLFSSNRASILPHSPIKQIKNPTRSDNQRKAHKSWT